MKRKYNTLLVSTAMLLISNFAMSQFQFAKLFGITGKNETIESTGIDSQANLFVTGGYYNTAQFDSEPMEQSAVDYRGAYISKLNSSGQVQWLKSYRASEGIESPLLTVNANGDVFWVGKYTGDLTIGTETINSGSNAFGGGSIFVVKYDNAGNVLWVKTIESRHAVPRDLVADSNGDLFLTGVFDEKIMLEGTNEITAWSGLIFESFTMKLSGNDGTIAWGIKTDSKRESGVKSITLDNAGNFYLGGFYTDSLRFSPSVAFPCVSAHASISSTNARNGFIAKYDASNGNFVWAKHIKGQVDQSINVAWCNANLYATFNSLHYFNYDNDSIAAGNYLVKIDPANGNKLSQKASSFFRSLTSDGDNAIYFSNDASNTYTFDTYTTTDGKSGMALGKLNNNGDFEWAEIRGSFGTSMGVSSNGLHAKNGAVFLGGSITAFTPVAFEPGMEIMASETLYKDAWYSLYEGEGVGLSEFSSQESYMVFPNPAHDQINVKLSSGATPEELILRDQAGRIVAEASYSNTLEFNQIQAGVYYLTGRNGMDQFTEKVIIK